MQVTKETWRMREQCVPGSLSSSPAQEPGNEATIVRTCFDKNMVWVHYNAHAVTSQVLF